MIAMSTYGYFLSRKDDDKRDPLLIRKKIRACAFLNELELTEIFVDNYRHRNKPLGKRPKCKILMEQLDKADFIITHTLSDLFFNPAQAKQCISRLKNMNIRLKIVEPGKYGENEDYEKMLNLIDCFIGNEANAININDKPRLRKKRRGKAPFGYLSIDDGVIKNPREQVIISEMIRMHDNGKGYLAIANHLMDKHEISLSHMGVKKILQRNLKKVHK